MKRIIYFCLLAFVFLLPPAWAQELPAYNAPESRPALSTPDYIAMTFSKLARQSPDFESWARLTPAYQAATAFDQMMVLEREVQKLKEAYGLLTLQEPLVIETPVKLSAYSAANHGFFIESFRIDTFFPARYNGQSYAIVPEGIMDKQWLKVDDATAAEAIDAAARGSEGRMLTMSLLLTPRSADKSSPLRIEGEDYWLISVDVKKMALYPSGGNTVLWRSDDVSVRDEKRQDLLNLYQ